jgi:hypothetical protein
MKFFVWINEQQQGPFDEGTIQKMISERQITSDTLLYPEDGGLDWTPGKDLLLLDSTPENFHPELSVEIRINPFQFLSYRPDKSNENSFVEIRLTSGVELKVKAVRLFDLQALTAMDSKKTEAKQKNQGRGRGSFVIERGLAGRKLDS